MPELDRTDKEVFDLLRLKTDRFLKKTESNLLIKEDIWENGTLVLRGGVYLTDELISKLLKFGIKRVNVDVENLPADSAFSEFPDEMNKKFISTQCALIVEKNMINAGHVIKNLTDIGFKGGNIFVTKEPGFINRYFSVKKINFLFIDGDLYPKCARCVQKFTALRNTHAFVLINSGESADFKKLEKSPKILFLFQPVKENTIKKFLHNALEQNFIDFWTENQALTA